MIDFMYPAEDGRVKTLNFTVNSLEYAETVLTEGERVDGSSLFPSFIEAGNRLRKEHGRRPCRGFCLVAVRGLVSGPDGPWRGAGLVPACSVTFGSLPRTADVVLSAHSKCRGLLN